MNGPKGRTIWGDVDFIPLAGNGQVVQRALFGDGAADEDGDAVADHFQFAEQVAIDEDGFALRFQTGEDIADFAAADRVYAVGGLVEEDQFRVVDHGLGEAYALGHPFGIGADFSVGIEAHVDDVQQLGGALFSCGTIDLGHRAEEFDNLAAGKVARKAVVFGEIPEAAQRGFVAYGLSEHRARSAGGVDDRHHDFNQRAFARAVGTQQPEDFAPPHLHGDAAERINTAFVTLGDVVKVNGEVFSGGVHWAAC